MPVVTIDNQKVEVPAGATILDAAEKLGIHIPTVCFVRGFSASTSCMVCVVEVEGRAELVPACGMRAQDGMVVTTDSERVVQARKTALELLLSDHLGDCMGPCQLGCPAGMDVPLMLRQIARGDLAEAIVTVKRDIALPAVLGRICSAPCEKVCRRKLYDEPVSICLLKRYVADVDLSLSQPYQPDCEPDTGKKVAIVGAGPAGLSCAYYLRQKGIACTIFERDDKPGGNLYRAVEQGRLSKDVLEKEIRLIRELGVEFRFGCELGKDVTVKQLRADFDAVFIAVGKIEPDFTDKVTAGEVAAGECAALEIGHNGVVAEQGIFRTTVDGIFAGGDAVRVRKMAVCAVADGKNAAFAIAQYLAGEEVTGKVRAFNSRFGKAESEELELFLKNAENKQARQKPTGVSGEGDKGLEGDKGFADAQAVAEAQRCMGCDCIRADDCKLRELSQQYKASQSSFRADRRSLIVIDGHPEIVFEPGKCIRCGLCIQAAEKAGERLGLTFSGRGYDMQVTVPFEKSIADALKVSADDCVRVCPTGALAFKRGR